MVKGELWNLKKRQIHRPVLRRLEAAIDRMSKLTYDLLHLAKLETISDDLRRERVDLSRLLRKVVEYVEVLARTKRIVVVSETEPHLSVWGDWERLEELVINLVSNAVKYIPGRSQRGPTSPRDKRIIITLHRTGTQVVLSIRDTGIGIRQVDIPHLFDRFYRADGAGRRRGAGLGLAICKQIVDKHGGTIRVDNAPGMGTTATVVFPRP